MEGHFSKLVEHPEFFRTDTPRSSNNVYRVHFGTEDYVVKNPGWWCDQKDKYYCWQDSKFYGNRRHVEAKLRLDDEVDTLERFSARDGVNVPTVAHYARERRVLALDYIPGRDFRSLSKEEKRTTLEEAMEQLKLIHSNEMFVGNTHVKKLRLGDDGKVYWVGFCGLYEQDKDLARSQAIDLLKFAYSTYMASGKTADGNKQDLEVTRDLTRHAARLTLQHHDEKVKDRLKEALSLVPSGWKLRWTTRMPMDSIFSEEIKLILNGQTNVTPIRRRKAV